MPELQTRCGKQESGAMTATRRFAANPCHGCARVRYQTVGITGGEIGERQLTIFLRLPGRHRPTAEMGQILPVFSTRPTPGFRC